MDEEYDFSGDFKKRGPEDEEDIDYAEVERLEDTVADPTTVRERIDNALESLAAFKQRKDTSLSRADIITQLSKYESNMF